MVSSLFCFVFLSTQILKESLFFHLSTLKLISELQLCTAKTHPARVGEQLRTVENMISMMLFYFYKPCFLILFSAPRCSLSHTLFLFLFLCSSPLSFHYFIFPTEGSHFLFIHSFRSLRLIEALLSGNFVPDI